MSKILIIDDEEGFTNIIKLNLEQIGGYEVETENKGAKGLETVKRVMPDLILLDLIMPDLDGGELARQLKEDESTQNIPIVFLTAVATKTETDSRQGMIGGHPFIAKPVGTRELIDCIEQNLNEGE